MGFCNFSYSIWHFKCIFTITDWFIMSMGQDVSEPQRPTGLLFIPRVIRERGDMVVMMMMPAGKKIRDSSTSALWHSYQQTHPVASRRNGGRSENFANQYLRYLNGSSTCRKVLRHGTSRFTFHPKEGVLRIFIAFKNLSPRLGLNQRPLGPVPSTLTTTPQRRLHYY
jgi:hypothetical protein